ncbi:hypothetical protein AYO45_05790 [Gammaproteobacteria bacterium SCGC AG-212-F23]|nr:hypothetical protein AYO45_05790 [Gammaproteobacteria bacterium SCGC AG-212-F23]
MKVFSSKLLFSLVFAISLVFASGSALAYHHHHGGVYVVVAPGYYHDRYYYDDYDGPYYYRSYYRGYCYWVPAHVGYHGYWHAAHRVCR